LKKVRGLKLKTKKRFNYHCTFKSS